MSYSFTMSNGRKVDGKGQSRIEKMDNLMLQKSGRKRVTVAAAEDWRRS